MNMIWHFVISMVPVWIAIVSIMSLQSEITKVLIRHGGIPSKVIPIIGLLAKDSFTYMFLGIGMSLSMITAVANNYIVQPAKRWLNYLRPVLWTIMLCFQKLCATVTEAGWWSVIAMILLGSIAVYKIIGPVLKNKY